MRRIVIALRMDLLNRGGIRNNRRDDRDLKRAGRGHDIAGLKCPATGLDKIAILSGHCCGAGDGDPGPHRKRLFGGVIFEISRDAILGGECIAIGVVKFLVREPVMPCRTIGHEAVPASGAPGLGDPAFFQNDIVTAHSGQMATDGQTCLPGTDDQRFGFSYRHGRFPGARKTAHWRKKPSAENSW